MTTGVGYETDPLVTVMMPIRNEADFIEKSLGAVLAQDYPPDLLQVIVADGMSTDATRDIIASLQVDYPYLELVDNPGLIVSTGLNAALRVARGEVIVRVDGHTVIARDYVRRCVDELRSSGADNVGGLMVGIGEKPFARAVVLATSSPFGVGGAHFHYSTERRLVDTVYMGAWKRDVFARIGFFDEELVRNQDDELNYRLAEHGGSILLSPEIKSLYVVRSTPRALASQYFQYGYWKVRVMQKHPRRMRPHHFVPAVFVTALLILGPLALVSRTGRRLLSAFLTTYVLGIGAAVAHRALSDEWPGQDVLLRMPFAFSILHVAYGAGFLNGLAKFGYREKPSGA